MMKKEISIIALLVLVFSACSYKTMRCNLNATLSMTDSVVVFKNYPVVELAIINNSTDTLRFPNYLFLKNYGASQHELYFEVRIENKNGKYQSIKTHTGDYDYLSNNAKRINLAPNEVFNQKEQINLFCYNLKPGYYKMRAHIDLSEYIDCRKFTSNWINFEIVDSASFTF